MAKCKPTLTLLEMERKLGYKTGSLNYLDDDIGRFYSDLRPVPNSVYEITRKEIEEHENQRVFKEDETTSEKVLPDFGVPHTITRGHDTVTLTRRNRVGFYSFFVDIHYGFGLDLPLLFTQREACRVMTVSKLQNNTNYSLGPTFLKLPKELRDKIYDSALPKGEWKIGNDDSSNEFNFPGSIGDPSGFFFPLSSLAVLRVNKQMRQEALALAYRKTVFHLDDLDDLIKFLIAVGDLGRDNIESLELAWQSRSDFECQWAEAPVPSKHSLTFPTLHVAKCVQLLKQCKRLRFLRLYFERDLVLGMSPDNYNADPGICELCSLREIKRVEIWGLDHEPLEQCGFVKWLKESMESSGKGGEVETGVGWQ